jgi:predicted RecB family nuclease
MRRYRDRLLFSASDLVTFLGCRHATVLDRRQLDDLVTLPEDDAYTQLLQEKGLEHERALRERLKEEGRAVVEIADGPLEDRTAQTLEAMRAGAEVIYQGAFLSDPWHGYADFLMRVEGNSALGRYHYEPLDTKLAHSAKPKHILQLAVYADLLNAAQGRAPERLHVHLRTGERFSLRTAEVRHYFRHARGRFEAFAAAVPEDSAGAPCRACDLCRWRVRCEAEWFAADHLSQVARITGAQIEKLNAAGVMTVAQLAGVSAETRIPGMRADVLTRLSAQARLQVGKRDRGKNNVERLEPQPGKGFERLPVPDAGDLFFDMEGDPLIEGGLEYLFGFAYREGGQAAFKPYWGHTRAEEKLAFEAAMDFVSAHLAAHPKAHVYHYAAYEKTALGDLAMRHGTREAIVDDLLRERKLVDLLRVVREAIRVSEPRYSIKNLEVFYRPPREGAVHSGGESVVMYERWRKLQDPALIAAIEDYNRVDCLSTMELRDWLLALRPAELPWRGERTPDAKEAERARTREEAERQNASIVEALRQGPTAEQAFRELVGQLLDFHRREAKPEWWFQFTHCELPGEELIEDSQCLGGLERDPTVPPFQEKRSMVHTYCFPPQDFKMKKGDAPRRATAEREPAGEIFALDEKAGRIQLKVGPSVPPLPDRLSLIPPQPIDNQQLRDAVLRYARSVVDGADRYPAVTAALKRELPRIAGLNAAAPVIPPGAEAVPAAIEAIRQLKSSYLLVQGPPGSGKTYLSARAIVALLKDHKRVALAAHSHKAINHLLKEVARVAPLEGVPLNAVKKCTDAEDACEAPGVVNVFDPKHVTSGYSLVAGTAWLFARAEQDQAFSHLFIDEAGQVSLGNLVAMGTCAQNLVLVGDQMQLSQPIKGAHPGESGLSTLSYLLKGYATIPPERGVFLAVTRQMHREVCRFISEAVYDGRLQEHPSCNTRTLILRSDADSALKPAGISWVPVEHQECTQRCEEEAGRIAVLFESLLEQRWIDDEGATRAMTLEDILIVSPYNMQVNLLQGILPADARVGTVDKFQGQEAAVVIVSMTASSAEDVPRGMEFLYSRNRINVAVSGAKSRAMIVASPRLLQASCSRIEQMTLVNTFCFAEAYAAGRAGGRSS